MNTGGSGSTLQEGRTATAPDTRPSLDSERYDTIVIGAGQAGLSVGYHLARLGRTFIILEAKDRVGDAWRQRWDSLRLFTPAKFDGLDGMPFNAPGDYFPTKDEMGDYLEAYAKRFELPVRTGTRVERVSRDGDRFLVSAAGRQFEADNVVIAMADFQQPKVPAFAADLDPAIVQLHSFEYRHPGQLRDGPVLIVGAGNSGSEIAMELGRQQSGRVIWMSGRDVGHVPFRLESFLGRAILTRLVLRGLFHRVLTVRTPMGRKARPRIVSQGGPLIRVKPDDLQLVGVERVPRTAGVRDGRPVLDDGRVLDPANIIWCTGFHPGFDWVDLPAFRNGQPDHTSGVVENVPGLYFVGLHFLHAMSSVMIHGVGRDAARIAQAIASARR